MDFIRCFLQMNIYPEGDDHSLKIIFHKNPVSRSVSLVKLFDFQLIGGF